MITTKYCKSWFPLIRIVNGEMRIIAPALTTWMAEDSDDIGFLRVAHFQT